MSLRDLLNRSSQEFGIDIDESELESIGLSTATLEPEAETETPDPAEQDILSVPLPGQAAEAVELFLGSADTTARVEGQEGSGLLWYPIIREGQWAVRPGAGGKKVRRPLKVIAGRSKNARKELGLQDLMDAFEDEAIQHVTVPSSHNNTTLENQGFVDKLKIVEGTVKDKATKASKKVRVLMGGYRITEPETKGKILRGTIANRSAGLLYDYTNTETGKTYPVALEHVALTNKPWITGMVAFGRKLAEGTADPVGLSLSDDEPEGLNLADDEPDNIDLADGVTWDHEDSPQWLASQVNQVLREARAAKMAARRQPPGSALYVEEFAPCYRCVEARPGQALVADGYGDDANFWVTGIKVDNGTVEVDDFDQWQACKKVFVPDDREPPPANKEPLDEERTEDKATLSPLQLAQQERLVRAGGTDKNTTIHPRGGEHMAGENSNGGGTLQLSDEAKALIQAAEDRAKAAESSVERLSQTVERLQGAVSQGDVESYISELKADGFDEAHGFGGVLVEIRNLMLADDHGPALQSEHFTDDENPSGELTLSQAIKRVMGAFQRTEDGKLALGEALAAPSTEVTDKEGEGKDGKPAAKDSSTETEAKSDDELADELLEDSPLIAQALGIAPTTKKGADA